MATAELPPVNNSRQFPDVVRERQAENFADAATVEGAALAAVFARIDFDVRQYGAVGDGTTNDTTAVQNAANAAMAAHGRLLFPAGGTYLIDSLDLLNGTNFAVDAYGVIKRKASSTNDVLVDFKGCTDVVVGTLRTDGNVSGNGGTVNEAKHDVRVEACVRLSISVLESRNPTGDTLYIRGASDTITIGMVKSISDSYTGRNAVSIIKGNSIDIGQINCKNTGYNLASPIAMPGGLDLEPNSVTDTITNVHVGSLIYDGAGTTGFGIYSLYGQIIQNVTVDSVIIKKQNVVTNGTDMFIRGAKHVTVGNIRHENTATTNTALSIDDVDDLDIRVNITGGQRGILIGSGTAVTNFTIRGSVRSCSQHGVVLYEANYGRIDLTIKNVGTGFACVNKNAAGNAQNITFRGDWAKDSTGSYALQTSNTTGITNWVLDGVDLTGWPNTTRLFGGTALQNVSKRNVKPLNFGTAIPTADANGDNWAQGDIIWNTAPAAGGVPGWVCVTSGKPGTWKAMAVVAA